MVDFAFDELGLARIEAGAVPDNRASIRRAGEGGLRASSAEQDRRAGARRRRAIAADPDAGGPRRNGRCRRGGVVLVAAVALVDADGRVLLARRPAGKPMAGLWEFPGGKIAGRRDARSGADPRAAARSSAST